LDVIHFLGCPLATSAAPQTFLLTSASYSHSTSASSKYQNIMKALALKRAASHIKVTLLPWLPPLEN